MFEFSKLGLAQAPMSPLLTKREAEVVRVVVAPTQSYFRAAKAILRLPITNGIITSNLNWRWQEGLGLALAHPSLTQTWLWHERGPWMTLGPPFGTSTLNPVGGLKLAPDPLFFLIKIWSSSVGLCQLRTLFLFQVWIWNGEGSGPVLKPPRSLTLAFKIVRGRGVVLDHFTIFNLKAEIVKVSGLGLASDHVLCQI